MYRTRYVLSLVVLYVGLAQSWDIAATKRDLLEFYSTGIKTDSVRFESKNLTALAYDVVHNMMLYVDRQSGKDAICGYDLSSKENKCFTEKSVRHIHDLAFDPVTEKLFFSDTLRRSINWISLKPGSINNVYENLLVTTGDGIPTDISVDSCRGYVYWINTNLAPPTMERVRFDGSEREVVITLASIYSPYKIEPYGLVIDQQTQRMYWIEPVIPSESYIYYADLDGKNKVFLESLVGWEQTFPRPSINTLTISKTYLYFVDFCPSCNIGVLKFPKTSENRYGTFSLDTVGATVGIAANYKIEEQIPVNQACDRLKSLVRNNCDRPFCVHGIQANGQSLCKCTPGYIGERCDVSVCNNYCLQGDCSLNDEGLPKCRCNAGYSGNRCEVYACHGYCLNNGVCSLNEMGAPSCQCAGKHDGLRCEGVGNVSSTNKNQY